MTYGFKTNPPAQSGDKIVATALDGVVYTENNRIHITTNKRHYVHKADGTPAGWYARNIKTNDDIYLGDGANPTVTLENLEIKDAAAWEAIVQPDDPKTGGAPDEE